MRRLGLPVLLLAVAATACDGGSATDPSPSPTGPTDTASPSSSGSPSASPPASPSPTPSPEPEPDVRLPADAPASLDDGVVRAAIASGVFTPLAPPGAQVGATEVAGPASDPNELAFTWRRGEDPFASEHGFEIWRRAGDGAEWRVVYAFTDRQRTGVLGVSFQTADLTGDALVDRLTLEDLGGSGACGIYRVVSSTPDDAAEVFSRQVCDTEIFVSGGSLTVREAVYEPDDPHCCPSAFRTSTLEWDGRAFVETSSTVEPTG